MSGHSKWATTKHQKGIADAKRSKMFTKIQKEITVAVKMGDPNPNFNPRLRNAIILAKSENMPKDKIETAMKRALAVGEGENYEEVRYEGYAPASVALIVEALTDNRNRTASNVRSYFTKSGSTLGETGSVSYMFDKVGLIGYEGKKISEDKMLELALEAGAENVESSEDWHEIVTDVSNFAAVKDILTAKLGEPDEAKITWKPQNTVVVDDVEKADKLLKLIDKLEDDDDVQQVIGNFELTEDVRKKLEQL
ncbi:MAG: YebC/PmpR family DNA-binding transcriptional regulator [Rickettsiales bacterium]|jgi:YebC/PmpR family DNA-binding regulatory protein|nr:YebC/PmpR family DNA-binding transcriptional regulator [Rickettsiales bacterium]